MSPPEYGTHTPAGADLLTWVALAVATLAPTTALRPLIDPSVWWTVTIVALAAAITALALTRPRTRGPSLPSVVAGVVGLLVAVAMENPQDRWLIVPSPAALIAVPARIGNAVAEISAQAAPVTATPGLGLVVAAAVLLAFLLAEALAVGSRAPALAGLPLLLLWTPALLWGARVPGWTAGLTIGAYVVVLAAQARTNRAGTPAALLTTLVCAGVAGALALALVPRVAALDVPRTYADVVAAGSGQRLDLGLNMRNDLVRGANTPVFSYSGMNPGDLGPLHTHTLTTFDGRTWAPQSDHDDRAVMTTRLWPATVDASASSNRVTIDLPGSPQHRLPLPEAPRLSTEPLPYLPESDEVVLPDVGEQSITLALVDQPDSLDYWRTLDPSTLEQDPRYLEVPATGMEDEIADLTQRIVADAESPYEQVLAVQNHLRGGSEFQYTTSVGPQRTADAVWDFLSDGRGYCVQFATAMVIMVRTLGIEARMAVGYLPGEALEEGTGGRVHAHDAHAWPQVRFPDAGWVRFEPTPADRSSTAPAWAPDPEDEPSQEPTTAEPTEETASESATEAESSENESATTDVGTASRKEGRSPWITAGVGTLVLALAAALLVLGHRRRSRRQRTLAGAWAHTVTSLERAGVIAQTGLTPMDVARTATARLWPEPPAAGSERSVSRTAAQSLRALAVAISEERYRPDGTSVSADQAWEWAEGVDEGLTARSRTDREPVRAEH